MNQGVRWKLSVMMFLEFFIWGAWLPKIFGYLAGLHFTTLEQGLILNAFAIASVTAMFFSTQFADRNFAAERFLAFSHLVGGLAMLGLAYIDHEMIATSFGWLESRFPDQFTPKFWPFFALMLLHSLFYVPTISITNSIAFANLRDPQKDFGPVRLWGTIGWIAAATPFIFVFVNWQQIEPLDKIGFGAWLGAALDPANALQGKAALDATPYTFMAAGIASLLLAGFSLLLPHTPPKPATNTTETLAWLEAVKLLRYPFLMVLFVVTFLDSCVHTCYFIWTERFLSSETVGIPSNWTMPVMTIGQIAEIGTMAFLGFCLKKLGWRYIMVIGILGHTLRFGVFAFAPLPWLAVSVNIVHGICYAFFFATVYIFVDEFFPKDARSSAQGLFNILILGIGPLVGNFLWPWLGEVYKTSAPGVTPATYDYEKLFIVPAAMSLLAAILLLLFFHPPTRAVHDDKAPALPH